MNRRDFLKKGVLASAGFVAGGSLLSGLTGGLTGCSDKKGKRIGLQLYSLRDAMGQAVPPTLELVSRIGYTELETAGYADGKLYGYAPKEFRKMCEDLGMKVSSAHLGHGYNTDSESLIMAWWDQALEAQLEAGCRYAIMPAFDLGETLDHIKMYCDYFNKVGEMAAQKGIQFGFHNHSGEFQQRDGQIILDYMLANTSVKDVVYEMDVYWVMKGGYDPVAYLNKYAGRFPLLHIKDESIIGDSGQMDFKAIFDAAYKQGMKDFYVEVEQYTLPPENCVEKSYTFLYNADFVK